MKKVILIIFLLSGLISAQLLTWDPVYVERDDTVSIIFDANFSNGGLIGYTGDVYAHTGVITENSSSSSDWKYVVADWGVNIPKAKCTALGDNKWRLDITPSVEEYYGVPAGERIDQIAMVFRSATQVGGAWKEGKTAQGGDIFLPLRQGINLILPSEGAVFAELNEIISIKASASEDTDTMRIFAGETLVFESLADSIEFDYLVENIEKQWIKVTASNASGVFASDSFYYIVNPTVNVAPLPNNEEYGINVLDATSIRLVLFAPLKENIYVIGDFNNWEADYSYYMNKTPNDSIFWLDITGLTPGEEYAFQYLIDEGLRIADPYAEKVLDPFNDSYIENTTYPNLKVYPKDKTSEIVSVLNTQPEEYTWQVTDFQKPSKENLVVYELLVRDFISEHNYNALIDTLDYLQSLGINAIELMPINEFEGNDSWGYNPSFYFAADKYYGKKNDLKAFIDECHIRGIAVIIDMVFNHSFGQSPLVRMYNEGGTSAPTEDNPYYNADFDPNYPGYQARHPFNVGYDFNHESPHTKKFVDRVLKFWINEYKVDGYRFDLSKGFTQKNWYLGNGNYDVGGWGEYDQTRVNIMNRMKTAMLEADPDFFIILEHLGNKNTEEKAYSDNGIMTWNNQNHEFLEAAMGYDSDFWWSYYKAFNWNNNYLITYMESHDEERMMYKNIQFGNGSGGYTVKDFATAIDRAKLSSVFFFMIPGPKMVWQFGELGYDFSIDYNGRTGRKPIRWDYFQDYERYNLYRVYSEMINLKTSNKIFENGNFELNQSGRLKRIKLSSDTLNFSVIGNFDVVNRTYSAEFQKTGWWYNFFSGDSINVTNTQMTFELAPGEYHIFSDKKFPTPNGGVILDVTENLEIPSEFQLVQNYPNPFNPSTVIRFALPVAAEVKVKIFNILGELVNQLADRDFNAGYHSLIFDGAGLSSGIYFYSVEALGSDGNSFIGTKKMIMVK